MITFRRDGPGRRARSASILTSLAVIAALVAPTGTGDAATVTGVTATVGGVTTTSLAGELLNIFDDLLFERAYGPDDPTGCDPSTTSTIEFSSSGPVTGPFPGTMSVSGSYSLGPQTAPADVGYPILVGDITSLSATFTITSGTTSITGQFTGLSPALGSVGKNVGSCFGVVGDPGGLGWAEIAHGTGIYLDANVTYSATVADGATTTHAAGRALFRQRQQCADLPTWGLQCGGSGPAINFYAPTPGSDSTPPELAPTISPEPLTVGDVAVAEPNASDPESEIAYAACGSVDTSTAGSFTVTCSATNGLGLVTTVDVPYTVVDPTPLPTVSIVDVTVEENPPPAGAGRLLFFFSAPLSETACLRFRDVPGTATEPADYFVNNGRTCFVPGTETAVTGVPIYDDGLTEGPETFQIEIYDLEGVAPGTTVATWTITDRVPPDSDGDGIADDTDNCLGVANPGQADLDGDGAGDACDDDIDGDGLSNVIEIWLGCDPHDPDSDGDGVWDLVEILVGTNPLLVDTDDDGEGDGAWLLRVYGSLCGCGLGDDVNGNGVWDIVEHHVFGGLHDVDLHGGGGFASLTEYLFHLCGCSPDELDGDGIPRIVRHLWGGGGLTSYIVRCGCHPWEDPDGGGGIRIEFLSLVGGGLGEDPDGDGIITVIELLLGCDPDEADTDGDGLSDHDETFVYFTAVDEADTDGDGMVDGVEIALGCDPHDSDSDGDGVLDGVDGAPLAHVHECRIDVTGPIPVGDTVTGTLDARGQVDRATIRWGDGGIEILDGPGTASFQYAYDEAGVYLVDCEVTDATGGTQTSDHAYVIVYDPAAGFVTGGGWIDSPAGAYVPDPDAAGPARFGFVSQYKKGATVPTGSTQFQFQAGAVNLHSNQFEWLVVSGASAQFKGVGSVNGVDGHRFTVTVTDGDLLDDRADAFRMRIWAPDGGLVYDNQMGADDTADPTTAITQGSIVIHRKGNK